MQEACPKPEPHGHNAPGEGRDTEKLSIKIQQASYQLELESVGDETLDFGNKAEEVGKLEAQIVCDGDYCQEMLYTITPQITGGEGVIVYQGQKYAHGESFEVPYGTFSMDYEPTVYGQGTHNVTLLSRPNTIGAPS